MKKEEPLMKQQLTAALLVFALLLTMTGCSAAHAVQRLDAAEDLVEARLDAVEDQVENSLRDVVSIAPAPVPAAPAPAPTAPAPTTPSAPTEPAPAENPRKLTEEQARQIALEHLSLTADQVTRLRSGYEIDDGILQYDVEFLQGDWEYEFEIHAETGKILSYDRDHKYD